METRSRGHSKMPPFIFISWVHSTKDRRIRARTDLAFESAAFYILI
jgi:hypothetical protein